MTTCPQCGYNEIQLAQAVNTQVMNEYTLLSDRSEKGMFNSGKEKLEFKQADKPDVVWVRSDKLSNYPVDKKPITPAPGKPQVKEPVFVDGKKVEQVPVAEAPVAVGLTSVVGTSAVAGSGSVVTSVPQATTHDAFGNPVQP